MWERQGSFSSAAVLLLMVGYPVREQLAPCYAGFELTPACIAERGLASNVADYERKVAEAMVQLNASYKIGVRPVNHPVEAGYNAATVGDVFTEVVRDAEMRNQSFIINVTADFLEKQPAILYEASALHEICHVMNDDLIGYHRNGANIEVAEERCVLQAVGKERYTQFLRAYATYQHWDPASYEEFLRRVMDVALVPADAEIDEADRAATEYFRTHADGKEHLLVYNGELHDISLYSTKVRVLYDPEKLMPVIKAGKPMVFFHNHPSDAGRPGMFPSYEDFGAAGVFSFLAYAENPALAVQFRVMQTGKEGGIVAYGFKGTALEDIRKFAREYRDAVTIGADVSDIERKQIQLYARLSQESFNEYLQYACPVDLTRKDAEVCKTHPQYFLWPSDRFFLRYRPQ